MERYAPADEWRISRNTYEALIDADTFAAVQKLADERKSVYEASLGKADDLKTPNMFRGLIFCADCGSAMNRRHIYSRKREGRVYYYSYLCPRWVKKGDACTPKNLPEKELLAIRAQAHCAVDMERIMQKRKKQQSDSLKAAQKELALLRFALGPAILSSRAARLRPHGTAAVTSGAELSGPLSYLAVPAIKKSPRIAVLRGFPGAFLFS